MSEITVCPNQARIVVSHDCDGVMIGEYPYGSDDGEIICIGWPFLQNLIDALQAAVIEHNRAEE